MVIRQLFSVEKISNNLRKKMYNMYSLISTTTQNGLYNFTNIMKRDLPLFKFPRLKSVVLFLIEIIKEAAEANSRTKHITAMAAATPSNMESVYIA